MIKRPVKTAVMRDLTDVHSGFFLENGRFKFFVRNGTHRNIIVSWSGVHFSNYNRANRVLRKILRGQSIPNCLNMYLVCRDPLTISENAESEQRT